MNRPEDLVNEALEGLERAHPLLVRWNRDPSYVVRAGVSGSDGSGSGSGIGSGIGRGSGSGNGNGSGAEVPGALSGKVALVSGGGSGHEPLHSGFVGIGMLDAAVPGAVFASPASFQIEAAMTAVDRGHGVLQIIKNYTGDVLNFALAADAVADNGIAVESVLVDDDLATDGTMHGPGRRGTAAVIAVEKICGAAAEQGADLAHIASLGRRVAAGSRSLAVALSAGTHPGEREPSWLLADDEIEFGVGIHGERGIGRRAFIPASGVAELLLTPLVDAIGLSRGDRVIVIVNGLGSTHGLELSVMFLDVARLLDLEGITIERSLVGSYVTSLDMAGCSLTLVRADDEIVRLWDAPVRTPALNW